MAEMKFTPGPWVADHGDGPFYGVFREENGEGIAYLAEPGRVNGFFVPLPDGFKGGDDPTRAEEHIANAHLLAAAPDLLAAARAEEDADRADRHYEHLCSGLSEADERAIESAGTHALELRVAARELRKAALAKAVPA